MKSGRGLKTLWLNKINKSSVHDDEPNQIKEIKDLCGALSACIYEDIQLCCLHLTDYYYYTWTTLWFSRPITTFTIELRTLLVEDFMSVHNNESSFRMKYKFRHNKKCWVQLMAWLYFDHSSFSGHEHDLIFRRPQTSFPRQESSVI